MGHGTSRAAFRIILSGIAGVGLALGAAQAGQTCVPTGAHPKHSASNCTTCHLVAGEPCFDPAGPAGAAGKPPPAFDISLKTCSNVACHGMSLTPAWNSGSTLGCNGCHGTHTTNGAPDYVSGSPKANSHSVHNYACNTCHAGTTADGTTISNKTLHGNGAYDLAPGPGISFTYTYAITGGTCANINCHFGGTATWGPSISHMATLGTGEVSMFIDGSTHDITPLTVNEDCTLCHYASLNTQHAYNCLICHSGATPPAQALVGNWNKTCQQSSCHPSIHTKLGPDHNGMYWNSSASCAICHDGWADTGPGPFFGCTICHDRSYTVSAVGDHLSPTTTSNALSTYVGPASIQLSATDAGTSGVSLTWCSLDGRGWTLGNGVYVAAPASGSRSHTLQFYSTDHAMNAEPVRSVTFTVQAIVSDTTPPATTSSFNPSAGAVFKASQPVTLTAADNTGGGGVKATYHKIDTGAFAQGASFSVTGDGLHTFSYYSVDNANNTESTHMSNQFRIDTVPPSTTCSAVNGSNYSGTQTFTLTSTDSGGSGVASTFHRLDTGTWTTGTSVQVAAPSSGSASHTLSWYSTDVATNVETTQFVTFTVQAIVSDTTPPATTSSFNPSAGAVFKASQPVTLTAADNTGGTGVKATYYRIDSGTFTQGTSFTITGDGLHTFSYYSVDNADNPETTRVSSTFRIDTVAPVTTCSAISGSTYTGAQTFTLSAADTGGSGVAGTWYRVDGGAWTSGTAPAVSAPSAGSASHTVEWYSQDVATNIETTKSVTFNITAPAPSAGTTTLTAAVYSGDMHPYAHFIFYDESEQVIADSDWTLDEHYNSFSFSVPSGHAYTMYAEWEIPDYEGSGTGSSSRTVSPSEATPGATVYWETGP